jgi:hypothetical protein
MKRCGLAGAVLLMIGSCGALTPVDINGKWQSTYPGAVTMTCLTVENGRVIGVRPCGEMVDLTSFVSNPPAAIIGRRVTIEYTTKEMLGDVRSVCELEEQPDGVLLGTERKYLNNGAMPFATNTYTTWMRVP